MQDKPEKKKTFRENLKAVFNGVSRDDLKGAAKDTVQDLRDAKELGLLAAAFVVPAGIPAYLAYRLVKYMQKQAANDNKPRPQKPKQDGPKI